MLFSQYRVQDKVKKSVKRKITLAPISTQPWPCNSSTINLRGNYQQICLQCHENFGPTPKYFWHSSSKTTNSGAPSIIFFCVLWVRDAFIVSWTWAKHFLQKLNKNIEWMRKVCEKGDLYWQLHFWCNASEHCSQLDQT